MKKIALFIGIIAAVITVWGGLFFYRNFRGAGPAVNPPIRDVTQIISGKMPKESKNTTGLPITLPDGFSISVFAKNLSNPRVMTWDPAGTLLVSISSEGRVIALPDTNTDGISDDTVVVIQGLNRPHGLAFHDGRLYVAETGAVSSFSYDSKTMKASDEKKLVDLPAGGNHFSRTIGFGPDGRLYITIGSSCNVCIEKDWRRAKMLIANADGTGLREYATGLRNSVFFVWHPVTKALWATDMGRDLLGDNMPPEEVNIIEDGKDYGWPYCYANRVHDDAFDPQKQKSCDTTITPHIMFQAHSAPLGLAFIPDSWPSEYRGDLLVAYHGSWNRSVPTGYKIVRFDLDDGYRSRNEADFLGGFLEGSGALGRPVDLVFDSKGNLFVADDKAGTVYRISQR